MIHPRFPYAYIRGEAAILIHNAIHGEPWRGLTAGIYHFQIRALGVLGYTDWTDPKAFVIA